jgi:flagellar basal body-associated protein FliL
MVPNVLSRVGLGIGIVLAAFAPSAATDAHAQSKETTTYLQMANITAVAQSASGQRGTVPVTVILQVANVAAASEVCRRVPSVRASIMAVSSRTPIPYAKGKLDSEAVSEAVANEINTAIALKAVVRAGFIHGTPKQVADTATDVIDPGDVTGQKQTMKSGTAGQAAPCRRIAAPPADLGWAVAQTQDTRGKGKALSAPPLRDNGPKLQPPPPAFETHPQFAPKK